MKLANFIEDKIILTKKICCPRQEVIHRKMSSAWVGLYHMGIYVDGGRRMDEYDDFDWRWYDSNNDIQIHKCAHIQKYNFLISTQWPQNYTTHDKMVGMKIRNMKPVNDGLDKENV